MDKSSQICSISWQNARISGGMSNLWILRMPRSPQKNLQP